MSVFARRWCAAPVVLSALAVALAQAQEPAAATRRPVTIAIVTDGPSAYCDQQTERIRQEIDLLVRDEFEVRFKDPPAYNAGWDAEAVPGVVAAALQDPEVDVVLVMGLLATDAVLAQPDPLPKPVLSGFVQDSETIGMPVDADGRSAKPGLTFVVTPMRAVRDLEMFRRMVDYTRVDVLIDAIILQHLRNLPAVTRAFEQRLNVKLRFIPVGARADEALARIDDDVQALYLTPPMRMDDAELQRLIDGINERRIPAFSMVGHQDVERGMLAGLAPDARQRLARRAALNLQQILLGVSPNELPVYLPIDEKLVINGQTAVAIGYAPPFELVLRADILHADALEKGEVLVLETAMLIAASNSIDIAVKAGDVESARQQWRQAGSALLPQVKGQADYWRIDEDRAESSFGAQPEDRSAIGAELSQVLFHDDAFSARRSARRSHAGRQAEAEAVRLDAMAQAGARFLDLLSARAVHRIDLENLRLTQSNLDLARLRHKVGTAGPEEVYRWEAQEARNRSSSIASEASELAALNALNQAMGLDQNTPWKPAEIELGDEDFYFLGNRLRQVVENMHELDALQEFSVAEAIRNSPTLRALDLGIEAQAIELGQLRRKGALPEVAASLTYDYILDQTFAGPAAAPGGGAATAASAVDDEEWIFAVTASLPLFEGGGRLARVAQARAELDRQTQSRERERQLIEMNARSAIHAAQSSQPNIRLSRVAADRTRKNLDVIRDKYASGSVSILDLLDAQNQANVEAQTAAIAVYTYLQDLIAYQRAISWFAADRTEEEQDQWFQRFQAFRAQRAQPAP